MRPFDKKTPELRIPWTKTIPNGVDQYSDVKRTLSGAKAMPKNGASPEQLIDASGRDRTLMGGKLRKPSEGTTFIPDDRKKKWKA